MTKSVELYAQLSGVGGVTRRSRVQFGHNFCVLKLIALRTPSTSGLFAPAKAM